jgi:hypothetical protein
VLALVIPSAWAGYKLAPEKVVENRVVKEVKVVDYTEISDANGKLQSVENARATAEARAITAESRLAAAEQAKQQAETQASALAAQLHELSPPEGDEKALERLKQQIDQLHASGVATETASISSPFGMTSGMTSFEIQPEQLVGYDRYGREAWQQVPVRKPEAAQASYRNYRSYSHKKLGTQYQPYSTEYTAYYHRSCSLCDHNCRIRQKMDEIYERLAAAEPGNARLRDEATKTRRRMDRSHLTEVSWEVKRDTYDATKYVQKDFKFRRGTPTHFHKDCATCEANHQLARKIEQLYESNPAAFKPWTF